MLIELRACKLGEQGQELVWNFYQHLVLGLNDDGESLNFPETVELHSWIPQLDWRQTVLGKPIGNEGVCITIRYGDVEPVSREQY